MRAAHARSHSHAIIPARERAPQSSMERGRRALHDDTVTSSDCGLRRRRRSTRHRDTSSPRAITSPHRRSSGLRRQTLSCSSEGRNAWSTQSLDLQSEDVRWE
ncbi:hypothetical protein KC19_4G247100 [Ceratodon purpureus]|uniref:Ig-like domain-containing protein n=1 Tax=Ceratodon purpureus TaxID=3225 RepID=A0A8T0ICB0_CERPU|nr:hypothetical protein KC19_4G247100 [Ceratodon purpureus]